MVAQIFAMIAMSLSAVLGWLTSIFQATQFVGIFLAFFFISLLVRYLLSPLLGRKDESQKAGDD